MLRFFGKGSGKDQDDAHTRALLEQEFWNPPPLATHEIRVLFCQESSQAQDVVLYDSQLLAPDPSEIPSPSPSKSSFKSSSMSSLFGSLRGERPSSTTSNYGSQTLPSRRPAKMIPGFIPALMFGTTPLAYKGSSTKVHLLANPAQVMLTKTFSIHPNDVLAFANTASTRRGSFSSNTSTSTGEMSGLSTLNDIRSYSRSSSRPIPNFTPDHSPYREESNQPPILTSSSLPNSSFSSTRKAKAAFNQRREQRASQTSMENGNFSPTPLPSSHSHLDSLGNAKPTLTQAARPSSYSVAVLIDVSSNDRLREFIFSHFALIEPRLHQLQALCLELLLPACRNRMSIKGGISASSRSIPTIPNLVKYVFQQEIRVIEAVGRFQQSLYEFYSAPRIQAPLWLNMNTYPQQRSSYATSFMSELVHIMDDSPSANQLVAAAISSVLCYHISWIPTVAPTDQSDSKVSPHGSYDPLWAQLSDLYGNIGPLSRICRTVVVGTNAGFVRRLLFVLSYFIRCNEVFNRYFQAEVMQDTLLSPRPIAVPSRPADIREDERGSPATLLRSISIPKRSRLDGPHGASIASRSVVPTSNSVKPQGDMRLPRVETGEALSSNSTPYQSQPTTPTTIESRPESDTPMTPQLKVVNVRTRTLSADTSGSVHSSEPVNQDMTNGTLIVSDDDDEGEYSNQLFNVPVPLSSISRSYPRIPGMTLHTETSQEGTTLIPAHVLFCKSYGRSLMAPYCDRYMSDFVLMGVPRCDFLDPMEADMKDTMRHFEIREKVTSAVCIVADTNTWKCNVFSTKAPTQEFDRPEGVSMQNPATSPFVMATLRRMTELFVGGLPAESCLAYLEDRLLQLYKCSQMLSSLVSDKEIQSQRLSLDSLAPLLGLHSLDMSLVVSVCTAYDDQIIDSFPDSC